MAAIHLFIICDDVREEVNDKFSLMGVYLNDRISLLDAKLPVTMSQLCFLVKIEFDEPVTQAIAEIAGPAGEMLHSLSQAFETPSRGLLLSVQIRNFEIAQTGDFAFKVRSDKEEEASRAFRVSFKQGSRRKAQKKRILTKEG